MKDFTSCGVSNGGSYFPCRVRTEESLEHQEYGDSLIGVGLVDPDSPCPQLVPFKQYQFGKKYHQQHSVTNNIVST